MYYVCLVWVLAPLFFINYLSRLITGLSLIYWSYDNVWYDNSTNPVCFLSICICLWEPRATAQSDQNDEVIIFHLQSFQLLYSTLSDQNYSCSDLFTALLEFHICAIPIISISTGNMQIISPAVALVATQLISNGAVLIMLRGFRAKTLNFHKLFVVLLKNGRMKLFMNVNILDSGSFIWFKEHRFNFLNVTLGIK